MSWRRRPKRSSSVVDSSSSGESSLTFGVAFSYNMIGFGNADAFIFCWLGFNGFVWYILFLFDYMYELTSSAVGQGKEVWSSCPGFDPRCELLAFFHYFHRIQCASPSRVHHTPQMHNHQIHLQPDPTPSIRRSTMNPQKMTSLGHAIDFGPSFWTHYKFGNTPPSLLMTSGPIPLILFF